MLIKSAIVSLLYREVQRQIQTLLDMLGTSNEIGLPVTSIEIPRTLRDSEPKSVTNAAFEML